MKIRGGQMNKYIYNTPVKNEPVHFIATVKMVVTIFIIGILAGCFVGYCIFGGTGSGGWLGTKKPHKAVSIMKYQGVEIAGAEQH